MGKADPHKGKPGDFAGLLDDLGRVLRHRRVLFGGIAECDRAWLAAGGRDLTRVELRALHDGAGVALPGAVSDVDVGGAEFFGDKGGVVGMPEDFTARETCVAKVGIIGEHALPF